MSNLSKTVRVLAKYLGKHDPYYLTANQAAAELQHARLLMPDLPEPARFNHRNAPCWETEGNTSVRTAGMFPVSLNGPFGEGWGMHPPEARDVAYALLAAANYAEKE